MRRALWLFILAFLHVGLVAAQQRPLITERAETLEKDQVLIDTGVEFLQDAVFAFSGLKGDLTRLGVSSIRMGAGETVELQLLGTVQNFLSVERRFAAPNSQRLNFQGNSTSDFGDLMVASKMRLKKEKGKWPAIAMRFATELPNAENESGLANDETNVFSSILLEKNLGKLRLLGNFGLAILGDPEDAGAQDDLYTYGIALFYPLNRRFNLMADAYGRVGPGGIGTEEQSLLRLGTQIQAAGLYWDLALFVGFRDTDPSSGLILGVSKAIKIR